MARRLGTGWCVEAKRMCMDATWHWGAGYQIVCTLNRGRLRVRVLIMDSLEVASTVLVCHVCKAHRFKTTIFFVAHV